MLKKLGIVKSKTKGYYVFTEKIEPNFINNTMKPDEYIKYCWKNYEDFKAVKTNNALNGAIFELIIATLFVKEGILPIHLQSKVAFVPNVIFDMVLYTNETGPIGLSMKTSLRERYKQADLEATALKYVHRKAESYLLTMDKAEAEAVSKKIFNGDVLGLNKAILVTDSSFNDFIRSLKSKPLITPGSVDIITSARIVTTEKLAKVKTII